MNQKMAGPAGTKSARPVEIRAFEACALAQFVIGYVLNSRASLQGVGDALGEAGFLLLMVGWILLITRRRSEMARWLYVVMTAGGLVLVVVMIEAELMGWSIAVLVATISSCLSTALLFTPASRRWFAS